MVEKMEHNKGVKVERVARFVRPTRAVNLDLSRPMHRTASQERVLADNGQNHRAAD